MRRGVLSLRDFDWTLLGFVLLLSIISVLEIYSATLHTKFVGFHKTQILWLSGGLVAMFVVSLIDYHILVEWVMWAYGFCLFGLAAVFVVGTKVLGARRWIRLGPIHFQPSEWVKIILIVAVARYFTNLGARELTWTDIFKAMALVGVPMLMVLKEPDLGTSLTYIPVLLCGLFLGGISFRKAAIITLSVMIQCASGTTTERNASARNTLALASHSRPLMPMAIPSARACGVASAMRASSKSSGSTRGLSGVPRAMAIAWPNFAAVCTS